MSVRVHLLPSSHGPSRGGFEHAPVAAMQVPASWHWSSGVQTTGVPWHTPPRHVSLSVQRSLSLQLPSRIGFEHTPVAGAQVPGS